MDGIWPVILASAISSILAAGGTGLLILAGLKTDVKWIQSILEGHEERMQYLEREK